ncbi:MAG: hypothetical protein BECKG1743E_GA0114224_105121, partial [Candidatus Kentron sp. G]
MFRREEMIGKSRRGARNPSPSYRNPIKTSVVGNEHTAIDTRSHFSPRVLRPSKFEGHCPMIRHGCRMALMVA